ncbi:unnamed protein product [Rotaria sp. Silwood2]|nr:unnamed protein product [Rotaria sp. Silwood2]CAF4385647.1 unnamed protein product [Rotaria sp. Silwood2]
MWKILQSHVGQWRLITSQLSQEYSRSVQIQGKSSVFTYANISIINQSGQIIESYSPFQSDHIEILTKIRVIRQSFRIQTILQLANSTKIQRIEKQLISPIMFTIELTNQPYMLSVGETIQMNYTINSSFSEQVHVRLQISDTLNLIDSDGIENNFILTKEISQMNLFTLPKNFRGKSMNDMVIFALSTYNNKTNKFSYENDDIVPVYFELNSASIVKTFNYFIFFLSNPFIIKSDYK